MERVKAFIRRLCFLPPKWTLIVAACGFGLLWFTLTHSTPPLLDHLSYHLATYALVVTVTALMRVKPAVQRWLDGKAWYHALMDSPLSYLLLRDTDFRSQFTLALIMLWNVVCALLKLAAGILLRSAWLRTLGIYYLLLAGLRMLLILPGAEAHGWRRYRACGVALLLMNQALVIMVIQLLQQKGSFNYPGPLIYLMAAYAFYALINATIRLAVVHRRADPIKSAARVISLTAAMVSVLALEVALIDRFGDSLAFQHLMVAVTGGAVCFVELQIALYMIRRGDRELHPEQTEKTS